MWANPREHAAARHSPSEIEACARCEDKTEAIVADVRERAGATNPEAARGNHTLRRLRATAAGLLIAAIIGGSAWFALDQRRWDAKRGSGDATGGDRSSTTFASELSRFGSFRP